MKVAIIGCGVQGSTFAAQLVNEAAADRILLLDYDAARAESVARKLSHRAGQRGISLGIVARQVDAAQVDAVAALLTGCDMLLNATMPEFNLPLMRACLASKTHYLDLYAEAAENPDDIAGSLEEQFTLHEDFRAADLIAIPCVGVNPGWIDVVASRGLATWDAVHDVTIRELEWIDSDELLVTGPPDLLMRMFLEQPRQVIGGKPEPIDLIAGEEVYDFPPPIGPQGVLPVSYNDASLRIAAHERPPSGRVVERFAVLSGGKSMKDILLTCAARQLVGFKKGDVFAALGNALTSVTDLDFGAARAEGHIRDAAWVSSIELSGVLDGARTVRTFECSATMEDTLARVPWAPPGALVTTALPLELALAMASGGIGERGVLQVSAIAEAQGMADDLERWGVRLRKK